MAVGTVAAWHSVTVAVGAVAVGPMAIEAVAVGPTAAGAMAVGSYCAYQHPSPAVLE